MHIGIIGSGNIGATLAEKLARAGHGVKLSNSRGPASIEGLARKIGVAAVEARDAVYNIDVIIISVPLSKIPNVRMLFVNAPSGVTVADTSNYYPQRDGPIAAIENGEVESVWVAAQLGRPVVKAWNAVLAGSFRTKGITAGSPGRLALPIAGDDPNSKRLVSELMNATGFDPVDAGSLAESWRIQPGNPAYCTDLTADRLRVAIMKADRSKAARRRDVGFEGRALFGEDRTSEDILHLYRALSRTHQLEIGH